MFADRAAILTAALVVCAVAQLAGCFNPTVEDGGFSCDPNDVPPCPTGLFCVGGICRKSPGGATGDLAISTTGDMAIAGAPADMSHAASSDMANGGGTCTHDLCTTGSKLTSGCDSCVSQICGQDSYCCTTKWSAQCVQEVASICHRTCP
jgi:hypothetical protein